MSPPDLPDVLLVHGFASSFRENWQEPGWVDLLADMGRTTIGVDLLGHGDAPKPHDPDAYADMGDRVRAVLPDAPVDAVGFSMGAGVVLRLAIEHAARFRRLVLMGVGANLFRTNDPEPLARALETGEFPSEPFARALARFAAAPHNDPVALAACLRRALLPFEASQVAAVTCPVLVVLGDQDFNAPADPLIDALPDARLVTLKGVDHLATPNEFRAIDAVLSFLGE